MFISVRLMWFSFFFFCSFDVVSDSCCVFLLFVCECRQDNGRTTGLCFFIGHSLLATHGGIPGVSCMHFCQEKSVESRS